MLIPWGWTLKSGLATWDELYTLHALRVTRPSCRVCSSPPFCCFEVYLKENGASYIDLTLGFLYMCRVHEQIELDLLCTGPKDLEPRNETPTIIIFPHIILYYKFEATGYFNLNSMEHCISIEMLCNSAHKQKQ